MDSQLLSQMSQALCTEYGLQIMKVHQQQEDNWLLMIRLADHLGQGYDPNTEISK